MRPQLFAIFPIVLPALAAAGALRRQAACNTGSLLCCNQIENASSNFGSAILVLLGLNPGSVSGTLGLGCSPITIAAASGVGCSAQLVCCENNNFNGVVAFGCVPVKIFL